MSILKENGRNESAFLLFLLNFGSFLQIEWKRL